MWNYTNGGIIDALIQYEHFPDSNTTFIQHIHHFLCFKYYTTNTHVRVWFFTRIPSCLGIRIDLRQLPCMPLFPHTSISIDTIRPLIFYHNQSKGSDYLHIWVYSENINYKVGCLPSSILCGVFFFGVYSLEVIVKVHRYMVSGTVTIEWVDIPPLLCDRERIGAIVQPRGGTQVFIRAYSWVLISLTLLDIRNNFIYFSLVWIGLRIEECQLCLEDRPWLDPWTWGSLGTNLPQHISNFLHNFKPFSYWYTLGYFFNALRLLQRILVSIGNSLVT